MRILLIYFLLILNLPSLGQEFYFKNIGTAQGLPSSETYHTLQDSKGFIWITTDAGICKYDGNSITTYTTKDGLPENVVFNVYEDKKGRIWFNSLSGYLFYYEKGIFKNIAANQKLKKLCKENTIIFFFVGEKDTLYCYTPYVTGLLKLPPKDNYKNIIQYLPPLTSNYFLINNKLNRREIIFGIAARVWLNPLQKTSSVYSFINNKKYDFFFGTPISLMRGNIDNQNNIYLAREKQLIVIRTRNSAVEYYNFSSEILFINQDKDGNLWIGTGNGGYFYKNSNLKSTPIHFLQNIAVSNVMIDIENNIWVCSLRKGMFKSVNKNLFEIFSEDDNVCNFYRNLGRLHIGFFSKKEIEINENDSISYLTNNLPLLPKSSRLLYFLKDKLYSYYGTNEGLYYIENQKNNLLNDVDAKMSPSIHTKKILPIGKDSIAIINTLEIHFFNKKKCYNRIRPPFIVKSMVQLKNKTLLIGSRNNEGIFQFKNDLFTPYLKEYPQLKIRINDIVEDSKGNLWIATNEKGLFCFSNNRLYEFNESNGLNSNKINEVDIDKNGNAWLATNIGLNKITVRNGLEKAIINSFNSSHGLPNLEIEHITVYNDKVWCSTNEHLFYFDCEKMRMNTVPPSTYLKSVSINDSTVKISSSPVLKYNENNVSFEFTGTSFKNPEKKEFIYNLKGFETDWKSSTTGESRYTNLPYGNYTFQVYALNNDKIKSVVPATFSFSILKPFWFTWWFISGEIVLMIFCVYLFIQWRVNKIKKEEEEKTRTSQKLADFQMTAVRAQMNPHFVFNALSSIQHYILSNDRFNSYDYLAKFSHLMRNVLDNSQEEYITLEKEIATLKLYIELEKIRFKDPFEFLLIVEDGIDTKLTYIPTMLIQPYVENAIWHGFMPKQNECLLLLEMKVINNKLQINLIDNGVGRGASTKPKDSQHVSKAMGLMEHRLKALSIKNNADFTVTVADLDTINGIPFGTEVNFFIPLLFD